MYYHPKRTMMKRFCGALACLMLAALPAMAGIPKPSLILYGKVFNGKGDLLTSGSLVWSFTPAEGGAPVQVVAALEAFDGPDGPFSYKVLVPLETPVAGFPASGSALPVATAAVEYEQSASILDTDITFIQSVIISRADIGSAKRVDVCTTCPASTAAFHTADLNRDLKFSLSEFLRVVELHSATPTQEYHVNPGSRDGYGLGPGPRSGTPHSIDFYGGPDWRVSIHELVRMVDLFTATPDHSYSPDAFSEDGFRKGAPVEDKGALRLAKATAQKSAVANTLSLERFVQPGPGGLVDITLQLSGAAGDRITGFGITETLPAGWQFHSLREGNTPFVSPRNGKEGALEFAWFPVPSGPFHFTYVVSGPSGAKDAAGLTAISGEGIYRIQSTEQQNTLPVVAASAGASLPGSGDGDGSGDGSGDGGTGGGAGGGTGDDDDNTDGSGDGGAGGGYNDDPFAGLDDPLDEEGENDGEGGEAGSSDGQTPGLPVAGGLGLVLLGGLLLGAMWRVLRRQSECRES